jgi:RNA polymerase sigma-70 factor, ECF subfamily
MSSAKSLQNLPEQIEAIYYRDAGRVLASLIGHLGDFELAQDVLQEAFIAAMQSWQGEGLPNNPVAWLITAARRKAIDRLRRAKVLTAKQALLETEAAEYHEITPPVEEYPDERLKLIFTCCHPALNLDARVALTLHTLGGLTTPEIANTFLVSEVTMAQRLVRAKRKIKSAGIPYAVPPVKNIAERLDGVLAVLYLIFNAGYTASLGNTLIRRDLCSEAIRLCRSLIELMAQEPTLTEDPEAIGLLALMLLHDSRRDARLSYGGEIILLEEQDRATWDKAQIGEGITLLDKALQMRQPGYYQTQAAISALHAEAETAEQTDWFQIAMLYAQLVKMNQSPVIRLNWAVAVAMATTPERGLKMLAELENDAALKDYYLFHAARADLLRRKKDWHAAQSGYQTALSLTQNAVIETFLKRRLAEVQAEL